MEMFASFCTFLLVRQSITRQKTLLNVIFWVDFMNKVGDMSRNCS